MKNCFVKKNNRSRLLLFGETGLWYQNKLKLKLQGPSGGGGGGGRRQMTLTSASSSSTNMMPPMTMPATTPSGVSS